MGDLSLDDLHATSDVVWDYTVSSDLAAKFDAAASAVEGQVGGRTSRRTTYGTHFQGYYAQLWSHNIDTANSDAGLLASRLRDVAKGIRDLEADARAEQARINTAREWKAKRDSRSDLEKFGETIDFLHLFHSDSNAPKAEPVPQMVKTYEAPAQGAREEFVGTSATGVSSALPDDLRSFTSEERAATDEIRSTPTTLSGRVEDFRTKCQWGQLACDQVLVGFNNYITSNDNDCTRTDVVAENFEAAGGSGVISTVSDAAISASLEANGISEQRPQLEIPPVQAVGNPPTSGFSNDPVNTATGNFVENEEDLRFEGGTALLGWVRSYSSLSRRAGGHGPGWASLDGCGLRFEAEGAAWTLADGREVVFPRLGEGFDRAEHENFWLAGGEDGWTVTNNTGARWEFTGSGRPTSFTLTEGATVLFDYDGARLVGIRHVRGHEIAVEWDGDLIAAVRADDGRRVEYRYDECGRLVEAAGPLGSRRYEWDEDSGLIGAVIDADGVVEARNAYDESGRVTAQTSRFGRVTRFAYLPGRVTSVSDADGGRANTWVADARGRLLSVTDSDGNRSTMAYDRWGNQVMAKDGEGRRTVRQFDERGRLVVELAPSGAMTRLVYDEHDRLTDMISLEDGSEVARTTMSYEGGQSQPSRIVDGEGGRTDMVWDGTLLLEVTDPTGVRVRFAYDEHGDLVASTDAAGNTTRVVRDGSGRAVELIMPSGATTRFAYDAAGLLTRRVDPDGAAWSYEYSAAGRLRAMVDPLGARTALEYGENGEPAATIDPLGRRVEQELDDLGNVSRVRLPDGAVWEFTHDAMSRLRQTVDPSGGVWTRHYDRFGRPSGTTDPTGVRSFQRYSDARREVTAGDAAGATTVRMDKWGRRVAAVGPDGSETTTAYDRCGRPVEFVDAAGGRTRIERDAAGRPVRIRRPGGGSVRYDYDECGRVAGVRGAMGWRTELGYDADSQLIREVWPTGERGWIRYDRCGRITARHTPGAGTFRWVYDRCGRIAETKDPVYGVRRFRYDEADQLVAAMSGAGGGTRYEYDEAGRAVRIIDPLGGVEARDFDAMDRCTAITDPLGHVSRAVYDAAGRLVKNVDADGRVIEIGYDDAGLEASLNVDGRPFSRTSRDAKARMRTIEDFSDPERPLTHTLAYDPRGLLVRHDRSPAGGRDGDGTASIRFTYDADGLRSAVTAPGGATTTYRRDGAGDVIAVEHPGLATATLERDRAGRVVAAAAGGARHEWAFSDGFASRHTVTGGGRTRTSLMEYSEDGLLESVSADGAKTRYRYDASAQMVEAAGPRGVNSWTYDAAGRLTRERVDGVDWERTYDAAGRLIGASSDKGDAVAYAYDRSGRRTGEKRSDGSRRDYEWTGLWTLSGVTDRSGGTDHGGGGDPVVRTTTLVDALGQLSRVDDEELFFDDATGGLLQAGDRAIVHAGPLTACGPDGWLEPPAWRPGRDTAAANPYLPPAARASLGPALGLGAGGELRVAGMEWLGARVLDPASRSFLSPDPVEPTAGAGWAANPYSYAGNNPVNLYDPAGLHPITAEELDAYRKANSPKWGTALAIIAGVGLAVFGGPAGIGAAIAIGAGLGAGANLIDQACSGYPINLGEVALSGALGGLGGGIGAAAGRLLGPAASSALGRVGSSPIGQRFVQGGIGGVSGGISGFITGGLGALATGGDFWQGAWSGAQDGGVTGFVGGVIGPRPKDSALQSTRTPAAAKPVPALPPAPERPLLGGPPIKTNPDFIADANGTVIPTSRARLEEGLQAAGFTTFRPDSPGTGYILPDGSKIRVMDATRYAPQRASFTTASDNPIDSFTGKPVQPPRGLTKAERKQYVRERTHVTLY